MSKDEIIAELSHLSGAELAEIRIKLDEIAGKAWMDDGELTEADRQTLDHSLAEYEKSPDAGSSWDEAEVRILNKLG